MRHADPLNWMSICYVPSSTQIKAHTIKSAIKNVERFKICEFRCTRKIRFRKKGLLLKAAVETAEIDNNRCYWSWIAQTVVWWLSFRDSSFITSCTEKTCMRKTWTVRIRSFCQGAFVVVTTTNNSIPKKSACLHSCTFFWMFRDLVFCRCCTDICNVYKVCTKLNYYKKPKEKPDVSIKKRLASPCRLLEYILLMISINLRCQLSDGKCAYQRVHV